MKEHVYYIFERIGDTVKDLSEDELSWTPCRGSNTVKRVFTHIVRIGCILIPRPSKVR